MRSIIRSVVLLILFAGAYPLRAQQAPSEFLGYELGDAFTPHHRVVEYINHLAETSPRVHVEPYGATYEGRPLFAVFVSSESNVAELETLRRSHLFHAGIETDAGPPAHTAAEPPRSIDTHIAVVWLSYNVHGNESVSTEAALATLFELVRPGNARASEWLEHTVVIIDPCLNPDGRERYVTWYRQVVGTTPNPRPEAREHDEPWPGGRTNHYYFDLNRDWAWATQQETRGRLALYNRWMPHVHVDFHEQGVDDLYYFAPAAEPLHQNVSEWQRSFQTTIGRRNAEYFDRENWLYFTGEIFDLFYPGYGDTWPIFNGAVGMTYEQAGSGRAGLAVINAEGDTLTLADRIAHHRTTGLATIETVAQHADEVVEEFRRFHGAGTDEPYPAYVVKANGQNDRIDALADHLRIQGIPFGFASSSQTGRGFRYATNDEGDVAIDAGDLVVPAGGAKSALARVLFDPSPHLSDSLTYDITAWALPYVYSVEAAAVRRPVETSASRRDRTDRQLPTTVSPYAYLLPWNSVADARFLARLLQEGVKVRVTERPFAIGGDAYEAGTLILTRAGNTRLGDRFDELIRSAASESGQDPIPVGSGFVDEGPDFGSEHVRYIERPNVALLSGEPMSASAVGEVWHFFDRQLAYPVTLLGRGALDSAPLDDYDVLILPDGSYGDVLTETSLAAVKSWVERGGRLIALESAVEALDGKEGFGVAKKKTPEDTTAARRLRRYVDRDREALTDDAAGSIYRVRVDDTHPLGFGTRGLYFAMKTTGDGFEYLKEGWNVGVIEADRPVSGFAGHEARASIAESLSFGVHPLGDGEVVYFVDDPLFRGFWYGGHLLFANAVFLAGR